MLILQGVPPLGGVKQGWGGKTSYFEAKCSKKLISRKLYEILQKLLLMTYRKLHVRFRLTPRLMTFYSNKQLISIYATLNALIESPSGFHNVV